MRGREIHPYDRKCILKSVIAGMRVDNDDYETLKSVISEIEQGLGTNVNLYRAEKVSGKFALQAPGKEDLSK